MPRTSIEAVQKIIDTDSSIDVYPFIEAANSIVTNVCAVLNSPPPNSCSDQISTPAYSNDLLELIERWLSAHFYAVRDPRTTSERAGDVQASYMLGQAGMIFESTNYGQQALALDTQGALAAYQRRLKDGVPPRPGVTWLGKKRRGTGSSSSHDWPY